MRQLTLLLASILLVPACGDDDNDAGTDAGTDAGPLCVTASIITGSTESAPPPDGIAGNMDLAVENGVIRAVFSAIDRPVGVAASGGTLMDLHFIGQSDHMNEFSQLAGVAQALQVAYTSLEVAESEVDRLVVEARGHVSPQPPGEGESPAVTPDPGTDLEYVTRYEIRCGEPIVRVASTLTNVGTATYDTGEAFAIMDVMFWGTRSLIPFCPARGQGDRCNPFDIDNPLAGLVDSRWIGATGSLVGDPGTFAFYIDDIEMDSFVGVHDPQVSAFGYFMTGNGTMAPGDTRTLRRGITMGQNADAASAIDVALDQLAQNGLVEVGTVTGTVRASAGDALSADPYRRPMVMLATPPRSGSPTDPTQWTPATLARVAEDGTFSARVPAGRIAWELRVPGRDPVRGDGGMVEAGGSLDLGNLDVSPAAEVAVHVRDNTSGTPTSLPARVIFAGADGASDPVLGSRFGGSPTGSWVYTDGEGDAAVRLPPGTYDVWATHGPYYTIARQRVVVAADDQEVTLELSALPVIPAGFITADFHVHSAASFDSSLPITDRVQAFLAEGVDAIVATEHDVIFDYAPALATIESTLPVTWRGRLRTFVGLESTTSLPYAEFPHSIGHHNAFPLMVIPGAHKNGAPQDEYMDPAMLYEQLRALPSPVGQPLVQLNHPRSSRYGSLWIGYFDACGFDPTMPFDAMGPCFRYTGSMGTRPWDFDAMEIINGKQPVDFINMSRDWYAILRNAPGGRLPMGTANSDSHELVVNQAAYPVTVLASDLALDALDDAALVALVESASGAGSLGVFAWATAHAEGTTTSVAPGHTPLAASSGRVLLDVRVAAAPWIPVEEVRVRVNGEVVQRLGSADLVTPTDPFGTADVVRYEGVVDLTGTPLTADSFITVEAGFALPRVGDLDGDGVIDATDNDGDGDVDADDMTDGIRLSDPTPELAVIAPRALPMAFTNPIFVDVDGDGMYTAPGTPLID